MLTRVLFVDDEPRVLDGLRRTLRGQRDVWSMTFALGGAAALDEMARAPYDVLVTDMRMPDLDGLALLEVVRDRWPHTARVVLSGYMDMETAIRSTSVAHQYLAKPCDPTELQAVIERTQTLVALLADPALRALAAEVGALGTRPGVYAELERALIDPAADVGSVGRILERDVALTAKVLQIVNSSFFGLSRHVSAVAQAVALLGADVIRALVLSHEIAERVGGRGFAPGFSVEAHQEHAVRVARLARRIVGLGAPADDAFLAGVLHDVGDLLLAARRPDWLAARAELAARRGITPHEAELELYGVSHAEVGAYLVGLWGLPFRIVEAIAHHHAPERAGVPHAMSALAAVHISDALIDPHGTALSTDCVRQLGVAPRLDGWRAFAERDAA